MAFTDFTFNKRLIILNADGSVDGELRLSTPYDVTSIDDRRVAVIQLNSIQIIESSSKREEQTINVMNNSASGISYGHNKLLYCEYEKGIHMLKLTDDNSNHFVLKDSKSTISKYVTSNLYNIYHTNMEKHIVTCYKVTGQKIWEFKDKTVICLPCSVSVDRYSNVYVASSGNKSIVVISPDGSQSRTLISTVSSWAFGVDTERQT